MLGENRYTPVAGVLTASGEGSHDLGRRGEEAVVRNLESRGWEILARNWRTDMGEADVIARDPSQGRNEVTMVEVKTRRAPDGSIMPEEAVNEEKQRRYALLAAEFMRENEGVTSVRFDVVAITDLCNGRAHLHHTPDAFGGDDR